MSFIGNILHRRSSSAASNGDGSDDEVPQETMGGGADQEVPITDLSKDVEAGKLTLDKVSWRPAWRACAWERTARSMWRGADTTCLSAGACADPLRERLFQQNGRQRQGEDGSGRPRLRGCW